MRALFNFQWTAQVTEFSQELADTLWDESQGIIDIAVKLYVLTQMRAIRLGARGKKEIMTKGLIQAVAKENLKLVRPMLDALRRKDWKALQCFEDLAGLDVAIAAELQKNWPSAAHSPDLEALASSLAAKVDGPNGEAADSLMTAALVANGISPGEMSAVMAMLAKMRASSDPIVEAGKASEIQAVPRRTKGKPAKRTPPTEPIDVRVAAFGDDPLSRLAAAGLLDKA